jgi:NOL1/NOP2/fmu family ribosome biogenesis protein
MSENDGQRFDRLPATPDDREVEGRASREEVVDWWHERFDVGPETFDGVTFWEKGSGKIWAFSADLSSPVEAEGLGITVLRTRQEHWKPTTTGVKRFARDATKNVIELGPGEAAAFAAGHDQQLDRWDGDWGYLIAAHELAGELEPIGVGLYLHGELRSRVPKGYQEELATLD